MLRDTIIKECINILKREDFKHEVKNVASPLIDMILVSIYPYLYLSLIFVLISFLLHLGIFFLLLRNKQLISKITI